MAARTGGPAAPDDQRWPGVADPAPLLTEIVEWLAGYGNRGTRRTYAQGLGLPVSPTDLHAWSTPGDPDTAWTRAVAGYWAVIRPATGPGEGHRPPAAAPGRLRSLHWLRWCAARGVDPLAARSTHVKAWLSDLADAGAAVATRDRMLATVKALYTHLADVGLAQGNPAALDRRRLGLVAPTGNTTSALILTIDQVRALLDAAATPRQGAGPLDTARAVAVVALFTLGLRVTELCDLDRADLHVTRGRRALRVRGKGGKTRVVYLHTHADQAVRAYLTLRDTANADLSTPAVRGTVAASSSPLLVTRNGRRYQRQAIWQLLRRLAATADGPLADVADALHPHALRHFYVTTAVEAGAQLVHIQADVGHSSIDTTEQVYNNAARDPSRSAVDLVGQALSESPS
ncbi:tyrosine-type recombinase/integrase [Solihabitans fulvus]|uniref:Tyrosine-type recombinase/integrase n=1 Tax=Solihabitans fulvus TaxID=1892852 RepID=A0A5B2WTU1_9PSEU|nr:tyrosine-type recombinase/integrase [Solihabitans fulvus]